MLVKTTNGCRMDPMLWLIQKVILKCGLLKLEKNLTKIYNFFLKLITIIFKICLYHSETHKKETQHFQYEISTTVRGCTAKQIAPIFSRPLQPFAYKSNCTFMKNFLYYF